MKKLTFLLILIVGGCSPASVALITQPNQVFYTSSDMNQMNTTDSIAKIRPGSFWLAKNLKFTLRSGEQKVIPKKNIWGYSDEKGNVWRCFKNTYYQVLAINDVVEYEIIEPRNAGRNIVVQEPVKKYSKTLDSRIVGSRKRAIRLGDEAEMK